MEDKRNDLRADLKTALRELAAEDAAGTAGDARPHIGTRRLIAYRQGTMPAAEREAVQEHLSLCSRCTGLLRELRDFEAASAGAQDAGPESLRQEAWESLVRRLPPRAPAARPVASHAGTQARGSRFVLALAAALLLAVVGLSLWAAATVRQERRRLALVEQRLEEREEALAAARRSLAETERQLGAARRQVQELEKEGDTGRVAELEARISELTASLEALRRAARAPDRPDRIAASQDIEVSVAPRFALRGHETPELLREGEPHPVPRADRFVVALSLADHPAFGEYRFELVDRGGEVLWTGRRPGSSVLGDAGTSVSIQGLDPGRYRLRIEGLRADRGERLAEYTLEVE